MVARSQNGYAANDTSLLAWSTVPGSKVRLRLRKGPVTAVLLYLASRFDDEVEDIDTAGSFIADAAPSIPGGEPSTLLDDWSYAARPIRGSTTTLSNHASGTAIDLNATQHPRGRRGTFTTAQIARVRAILTDLDDPATGRCVVRWGEDYQSAPTDGMHFEINADEAAVARVAARLEDDMPTAKEIAAETVSELLRARLKNSHNEVEASFAAWLVYGNEKAGDGRDNSANALAAINDLRGSLATTISQAVADAVKAALADGTIKVDITVNGAKP